MDHFTWYTARAAGITAYLLLFGTVATGLLVSGPSGAWWKGVPLMALHRFVTWLMGAFLAIHVVVLMFDTYLRFSVPNVLVPFSAAYEPFWTGMGVIAMYLLVAVIISTAVRRRLQNLVWYGLHLLSYPAFVFTTAHGIKTGSDTRRAWMVAIYVLCAAVAALLLALRFAHRRIADQRLMERWGPGALAGAAFGGMVLVLLGTRVG
jgi:sulfoxide reductase heme-binding subunit YedZ